MEEGTKYKPLMPLTVDKRISKIKEENELAVIKFGLLQLFKTS